MAFGTDEEAAVLKLRLDTSEVDKGLQQTEQGFQKWIGSIKSALAAAGVFKATQLLAGWLEAGGRVADMENNLSVDVSQATKAIDGQISRLHLIESANRLAVRGMNLTATEFRAMSVAAMDFSDRTGTDAVQALDMLTQAVIRGSQRGLKQFGIEATTSEEALRALREEFGDATNDASNAAEQFDRLKAAATGMFDQFTRGIAESEGLEMLLSTITDTAGGTESAMRETGSAIGDLATVVVGTNIGLQSLFMSLRALREFAGIGGEESIYEQRRQQWLEGRRQAAEAANAPVTVETTDVMFSEGPVLTGEAARAEAEAQGFDLSTPRRGGGGGGGGARKRARPGPLSAMTGAEIAESLGAQQHWYDESQSMEGTNLDFLREINEERVGEEEAMTEFLNEQEALRLDAEREAAEEREQLLEEEMSQRAAYAQTLIAVGRAAIAEGKSAANVQRALTRAALDELASWAEKKAAWEVAEAIAAAARYDYGAAGLHAAAAIAYGAVAVGASALSSSDALSPGGGGGLSREQRRARGLGAGLGDEGSPGLGRASGGGGSDRPVNVTIVYSPSTGGFIPDANIRDLLDQIGEGVDRGYRSA